LKEINFKLNEDTGEWIASLDGVEIWKKKDLTALMIYMLEYVKREELL